MTRHCECGNTIHPQYPAVGGKDVYYCTKCGKRLMITCLCCNKDFNPYSITDNRCPSCKQQFVSCKSCATLYPVGTYTCKNPLCVGTELRADYNRFSVRNVNEDRNNVYQDLGESFSLAIEGKEAGGAISDCIVYCDNVFFWKSAGSGSVLMRYKFSGAENVTLSTLNAPPNEINFFDLQGIYMITCANQTIYVHSALSGDLKYTKNIGTENFRVLMIDEDIYVQSMDGDLQKIMRYKDFSDVAEELQSKQLSSERAVKEEKSLYLIIFCKIQGL